MTWCQGKDTIEEEDPKAEYDMAKEDCKESSCANTAAGEEEICREA